jgi:hypothetical protein
MKMITSRVSIEFVGVPAMRTRELNNVVKLCWHTVGIHWHTKFMPLHFTSGAFTRYDYTPRSKKYWFRKLRKLGQALPIVLTGMTRRLAKSATINATHKGVRIAMPVSHLNRYKPRTRGNRKAPNLVHELTQINAQEYRKLEGVMAKALKQNLNQSRLTARVVVGA